MSPNAVKRLGLVVKKATLTHAAFAAHWLETHAALCVRIPHLRRYSVNLVDRQRFPGFGYDGFSELWFDSEADMMASFASPAGQTLLADLPNFTERIDPIISHEYQKIWP